MSTVLSQVASSNRSVLINRCTLAIMMARRQSSRLQRSNLIAAASAKSATKRSHQPQMISARKLIDRPEPINNNNKYPARDRRPFSRLNLKSSDEITMSSVVTNGRVNGHGEPEDPLLKLSKQAGKLNLINPNNHDIEREYHEAIKDLNDLQSNTQVLALAKYKKPETILPLFSRQLQLAGIDIDHLNRLNAIHVSGTKGKGSTCAFLESILLSLGPVGGDKRRNLKVGCYNSPHLVHVTERIRIDGRPIDRSLFVKYFRQVFDKLKQEAQREQLAMPSYFSFLTILAFHIFLQEQVDCAIIEVGIGGEYDPTNIIRRPVACAITTLDLEHTNILGNTIESIAWTKAGIIKPGVPMFTVEHDQEEATEMLRARALQKGSPVYICKPLESPGQYELGIKGPAQAINASVACQLARHLIQQLRLPSGELQTPDPISLNGTSKEMGVLRTDLGTLPRSFLVGLERSRLPGRCQIVENEAAVFFLDGAHTKKSMVNCLSWFMEASPKLEQATSRILMVNVIGERNKTEVLRPLLPQCKQFDKIVFTSNQVHPAPKSENPIESETFAKVLCVNHEKGFENVKNNAKVWLDLVREYGMETDSMPEVIVRPTIIESIQAILAEPEIDHITGDSEQSTKSSRKPHILATGSLHFVGALLDTIEKLDSNKSVAD